MAALILNQDEQTLVETVKTDARLTNSDGISVDTDGNGAGDTPYCTDLPLPVKNFNGLSPPGSLIDKKVADGLRAANVPLIRHVRPFGFQAERVGFSPLVAVGATATDLLTITIPAASRPTVARQMMATVSLSAFATSAGDYVEFWLNVNGTATSIRTFYFTAANTNMSASSNWLITLPVGATSVKLVAKRAAGGAGTINFGGLDCAALTLLG